MQMHGQILENFRNENRVSEIEENELDDERIEREKDKVRMERKKDKVDVLDAVAVLNRVTASAPTPAAEEEEDGDNDDDERKRITEWAAADRIVDEAKAAEAGIHPVRLTKAQNDARLRRNADALDAVLGGIFDDDSDEPSDIGDHDDSEDDATDDDNDDATDDDDEEEEEDENDDENNAVNDAFVLAASM